MTIRSVTRLAWPSRSRIGQLRKAISRRLVLFSLFLAIALSGAMYLAVHRIGFLLRTEFLVEDVERAIYTPVEPQQPDIVIVTIDDSTLDGLPYTSPINRAFLKRLIETIAARHPRAIGVDILFDRPTDPADDDALKTLFDSIKTPLVVSYVDNPAIENPERLAYENQFVAPAHRGAANLAEDPFDTARYIMPGVPGPDGRLVPSFPRRLAGKLGIPSPPGLIEIAWRGRPDADSDPFRMYPAQLVPLLNPDFFAGKVVLIGSDFSITDRHRTPFAAAFEGAKGVLPGIVIQAHALAQLLERRPADRASLSVNLACTVLLALLGVFGGLIERPFAFLAAFDVVIVGVYWVIAFVLFHYTRVMVEILPPSLALLASSWITESLSGQRARQQREFIRKSFSQYVPEAVVKELIQTPERLSLQGQRRELTIMFTDIADFTTLSEQLGAQKLGTLLNAYFTGLCQVVFDHQGTVLKFMGDGSFSIFNAPIDQPDHALRGLRCAIELDRYSRRFGEEQRALGVPFGTTRIGLHTGEAEVGNYGSFSRKEYGAMGDAINATSRIEGINKIFGTRVCVSAVTAAGCTGIAFRPLGDVILRGKTIPIALFEPVESCALSPAAVAAYLAAFNALASGNDQAQALFEALARDCPTDRPTLIHLERLRRGEVGTLVGNPSAPLAASRPEPA